MTARISKPAKNAMQSGTAKTREWQLDYEPEQPQAIEPLMGWTSSGDMKQQLTIRFDTKEDAVAYYERVADRFTDAADAESLYTKLEHIIVPMFYNDRERYLNVMQHAIAINGSFFNTQRMVHQYITDAYMR